MLGGSRRMGDENGNLHIPESLNMPHFIKSFLNELILVTSDLFV